jgi:hypothetical protein
MRREVLRRIMDKKEDMTKHRVGILGATGMVGQRFIQLLGGSSAI